MITGVIDTRIAKIRLDMNGILHVIMKDQAEIELDDVKEIIEAHLKLSKDKRIPVLTDARKAKNITREARLHSVEESKNQTSAVAVLTSSPLSRILGGVENQ
ncbi:MAG: hypothetical protein ACFFD4_15285 [Candidatus Odinarchaeota archaeon]